MSKIALALCFAGATLAIPAAHAQLSPDYNDCHRRAHGDTVQEGMCYQHELTRQDDRLNKAYQALMTQYAAHQDQKIALRDEERSWLKRRDYDCKLNRDTIDNDCLVHKTAERADHLEQKLKM